MAFTTESSTLQKGYIGSDPSPEMETSALTKAGITLANAQDLSRRVQQLADRLLGPVPTAVSSADRGREEPAHVLPALRYMADQTASMLHAATDALDRIERSLP